MTANIHSYFRAHIKTILCVLTMCMLVTPDLFAQNTFKVERITENNGHAGNFIDPIYPNHNGLYWSFTDRDLLKYHNSQCTVYDAHGGLPGNHIKQPGADCRCRLSLLPAGNDLICLNTLQNQNTRVRQNNSQNNSSYRFASSDLNPYHALSGSGSESSIYSIKHYDLNREAVVNPETNLHRPGEALYFLITNGRGILVASGKFDDSEKILVRKMILAAQPPFYVSSWFILLLVTGVTLSSYFLYQYHKSRTERKLREAQLHEEIEEERRRIGRDLHDNIGAYTTSLIMKVENLELEGTPRPGELKEIREDAHQIMSLLRQTIWVLKTRETTVENCYEGLLGYSVRFFKSIPNITLNISEDIQVNRSMESTKSISLFRILQEALHNIVKHSKADTVDIHFKSADRLSLTVNDNGNGFNFNEKSNGYGLHNIKTRAEEIGFELTVTSSSTGTEIKIEEK